MAEHATRHEADGTEDRRPVETAIDPELEIVDPHHHLSDRFGEPYYLDDLLADTAAGHNVTKTVFVESGWLWDYDAPSDEIALPEIERVAEMAEESSRRGGAEIAGIIGHVELRKGAAVIDSLDLTTEAARGRLVGIRDAVSWDADPRVPTHRHDPPAMVMSDPQWREGFAELARRDLTFDCLIYPLQLVELADLARTFPDTTIVIEHLAFPLTHGHYHGHGAFILEECALQFERLAAYPNVYLKIGGIGTHMIHAIWGDDVNRTPSSAEIAALWGPHVRRAIAAFGADHCMFESNFPVDRQVCNYAVLWNAFKQMVPDASPSEKADLFRETATRAYRLDGR